jgi:hypothetical protein
MVFEILDRGGTDMVSCVHIRLFCVTGPARWHVGS